MPPCSSCTQPSRRWTGPGRTPTPGPAPRTPAGSTSGRLRRNAEIVRRLAGGDAGADRHHRPRALRERPAGRSARDHPRRGVARRRARGRRRPHAGGRLSTSDWPSRHGSAATTVRRALARLAESRRRDRAGVSGRRHGHAPARAGRRGEEPPRSTPIRDAARPEPRARRGDRRAGGDGRRARNAPARSRRESPRPTRPQRRSAETAPSDAASPSPPPAAGRDATRSSSTQSRTTSPGAPRAGSPSGSA